MITSLDIGAVLAALIALGGGMASWFLRRRERALDRVTAELRTANEARFALLQSTVESLQEEMDRLRSRLEDELRHVSVLEAHVSSLEALLRTQGVEPPPRAPVLRRAL
ncbi:MAG: hypothetical protein AAFR84_02310 [Pseudomonadota bacterium]